MIVIPMAGLSRRFAEAGYQSPKYMLPLGGRTVFDHAMGSFDSYFSDISFLFICRDVADTPDFIVRSCAALGIKDAQIVTLGFPTAGQAETVELGLIKAKVEDSEPITIFNIDTFRPGFRFPVEDWWSLSAGYLEVFRGSGENWSYVKPSGSDAQVVTETAEKRPISDLCCTGLYHFAQASEFRAALATERMRPAAAELYVAPLYNHLIAAGKVIHYVVVDPASIVFCGVPSEYEALQAA